MKFSVKKLAFSLLSVIGITATSFGVAGCVAKASAAAAPDNIEISFLPPPEDGSLPTAHSGSENLAYINYVFAHQEQYHSYSYGDTKASIATQTTRTFRDYKDGVLVTTDLTFSSMVKGSTQTCTIVGDGEKESEVYFRAGEAPASNKVAATDIEWSEEAPSFFSVRNYNYTYGLLPNELFNYIVNDNTLISCEPVRVTSEGNYELSFSLDPVASTYYYQYGMKTRGGLADYPEFVSVSFKVTFDGGWQILKSEMSEHARVNKGLIVDSYSDFYCDYYYGGENFDNAHYAYYENYYKQYVGDETLSSGAGGDEDAPLDIAGALSNGFAKVLNGGEQFAITAKLGRNVYSGFVWLSLDLDNFETNPVDSIALKLSLGRNFEDQSLYAEFEGGSLKVYYGPDFAINANLTEVSLQAQQFEDIINKIANAFKKDAATPYAAALADEAEGASSDGLTELLGSMTIEETGNQAVVSLVTDDLLGLGIGIDVKLTLGINGKKIAFRSATVGGLTVKGKPVELNLLLRTTTEPLISREERNGANLAEYMADVHSLLASNLIKVDLGLHGGDEKVNVPALKNVDAEVVAYVDLNGITVGAEAFVRYNNVSARAEISYDYSKGDKYGSAAIYLKEFCGNETNLKLCCNIEDLVEAVGSLVTTAGADLSLDTDNLIDVLCGALSVNFTPLISDMYADGSRILIGVDVDTVLSMVGIDAGVKFGGCTLAYDRGEGANGGKLSAALPAIGFSLNVSGESGQISSFDKSDCLDISYVLQDVEKVINAKAYKISLTLDGDGQGVQVEQLAGLKGSVNAYLTLENICVGADARVSYSYNGAQISAALSVYYNNESKTAMLSLTELMGNPVSVKLRCNVDELLNGINQILAFAGKSLDISLGGGMDLDLSNLLADLLNADFANLLPTLESSNGGLKLGVNVDEALKLFNIDLGLKLGTVTLAYNHEAQPLLSAAAPALGLGVTVDCTNDKIEEPVAEDYLDLCYVIDDVLALAKADKYQVSLKLNGSGKEVAIDEIKGLKADIEAYLSINGIVAGADVTLSYEYKGLTISAALSVWYEQENNKIALYLSEIMGVQTEVKLFCNVDDIVTGVKKILEFAGVEADLTLPEGADIELESVLSGVLSADFSVLLPTLTTSGNGFAVAVNVDEVLKILNVDLGIKLGSVSLTYRHGESAKLFAEAPAVGLSVAVCGANGRAEIPDTAEYLDLAYVTDDVLSLLNEDNLIKLNLSLNGSAEGVTLTQLNGVNADLTAYLDLSGKSVKAEIFASYTGEREEDGKTVEDVISAGLDIWYSFEGVDFNGEVYGVATLSLTQLNGVDTDIKLYCDISEVKSGIEALIKRATVEKNPVSEENKKEAQESADILSDVLSKLADCNLSEILTKLTASDEGLTVQVDADKVLKLFNVETGISFGRVNLAYRHGQSDVLFANIPAFGASLTLGNTETDIGEMPAKADCLDINDIISVVNGVWDEVDAIIDGKAISFEITRSSTYLALDGLVIGFGGNGEICWAKGSEYVALDLAMSITENEAETLGTTDSAYVKVIYDKNAKEAPLIRLAINEVAIDICKEDIDGTIEGFNTIYNKVKGLLGISEEETEEIEEEEGPVERTVNTENVTSNDKLMSLIFKVLASKDWVNFLNDLTLTSNGKSVVLNYLSDNAANVAISADGGIKLHYDGAFGKDEERMATVGGKRFALSGDIAVSSAIGSLTQGLNEFFDLYSKNSGGDTVKFIRNAYDFLFEAISCFNVNDILGSDTYAVTFTLNGNNCNIAALKDVFIDAEIYVTGSDGAHGKLAEGFLNVNAAGVVIKLNVITQRVGGDTKFYINLSRVMDVVLPDLKFLATQDSLYRTIDALIGAVNNTNVIDFVTNLLGSDGTVEEEVETKSEKKDKTVLSEEQISSVASLIEKLVNFNFSEAFIATAENGEFENGGVLDAQISLDNVFTQLGLKNDGGSLGSIRVQINHNDHSMTTYGEAVITNAEGVQEKAEWISLSSARTQRRDYSKYNPEDYISVEFLPDLLNDLVNFATGEKVDEDGNVIKEVYDSFTLSGSINANINLVLFSLDLNIDIHSLTVSIGEDGFWFSGILHVNKVSALGLVTIPESTVGITYANGYITLVKGITSDNPEYKIMTLEYFLDHMLVENGSVLKWWLGVKDKDWSRLVDTINSATGGLDISSGLTNPEDIYLYSESKQSEEYEISMYDFVDSLRVMIDGKQTACFGDYTGFEKQLGISDNYYGFALNGGKISGGVLNKLYAAITRTAQTGISGVKAYASIDAGPIKEMVKLSVNLNYQEGLTEANDYQLGTSANSGTRAINFYDRAIELAGGEENIDFAHNVKKPDKGYDEIFGCYSTADSSYDYSHMLYTHQLTIVGLDGVKTVREVRHGSTVYLYDNNSPIYTDSTKKDRIIYSTDGVDVLTTKVVVDKDMTVCAVTRPAVTAIITSGSTEYEITTFVGDRVPTSVKGLETLGSMYYDASMTQAVGANDLVGNASVIRLYGVLVQSEITVNYVNYKFTYDANSPAKGYYTAIGRGAGFNDYYSTNGNTLVIENEIDGYPVVAIAEKAFADTDGHPIVSVVVPANVTYIGEKAFADNVGMRSATFLASEVTVGGSSGEEEKHNTTPFYGCSAEEEGTTTNLVIYYNSVKFEGSTSNYYWTKFRRDGSGAIYHRYYVGVDPNGTKLVGDYDHASGGALHSAGKWQYVNAEYTLDVSGVASTMLNEASVERFIAQYYPISVTSDFASSPKAAEIEQALGVYLAQFDMSAGGVTYKCNYTVSYEVSGSVVTVSYAISFTQAASITVVSNYNCVYYGVSVAANVPTQISIPVEDLENLATPTDGTYILSGMQVTEQADGSRLCNLTWREKYTYTVSFTFKGNLVTTITMSLKDGTSSSKKASAVSSPTFSFTVKEGQRVTATGNDGKTMTLYIDGVEAGTFTTSSYSFKSGYSFNAEVYSNSSYTFKF